jgi:hypothetical protein
MSFTLLEATLRNPNLARLQELTRDSSLYLQQVLHLIPAHLRTAVKAGPLEPVAPDPQTGQTTGITWCMVTANSASASKLRQLLPTLLQHLQKQGYPVTLIRLAIEKA